MVDNATLRENARKQLGGNIFKSEWLMMLVICLIVEAALMVAGSIIPGVGSVILCGPAYYGLYRVTTSFVNGKSKIDFADLVKGFTEDAGNTILLGFLRSLFTALWALLFVIPGIVKYYSYSMSSYIQQDESNKDWKYCLDKSKEMTNGYKMQLFLLDLSFIGWYLLGALCLGVGVLFVVPYHETARAHFYEALKISR